MSSSVDFAQLRKLALTRSVRFDRPTDVKQLVFLTADRIQPFLGALSAYPATAKVRPAPPSIVVIPY